MQFEVKASVGRKLALCAAIAIPVDAAVRVELANDRTQEINIHNLEGNGSNIWVNITESKEGRLICKGTTCPLD